MSNGIMPLADYHIHPDFSFDAKGSLDEHCQAAVQKGLTEICFTSHYDTDPRLPEHHRQIRIDGQKVPLTLENFGEYVTAVERATEKFVGMELVVQCGVEVGYYPGCEEEIKELFGKYRFHYRLGSIHQVNDIDICNDDSMKMAAEKYSLDSFADMVFEDLIKSAECGLFHTLGHLDMYKKYGVNHFGKDIFNIHNGRLDELFEVMSANHVGLEINTSALRRGHTEYYPSMSIVNAARAAGVQIVAVGSDAHRPSEVAFDFEAATAVAYELSVPYCGE